jgi:Putative FMN-binding domain
MYIPAHFAVDPAAVEELLARHGAADLITLTDDGLLATMLPFAYEPSGTSPALSPACPPAATTATPPWLNTPTPHAPRPVRTIKDLLRRG